MKKKDGINWSKCMKKKCEQCNRINYCFIYDPKSKEIQGKSNETEKKKKKVL